MEVLVKTSHEKPKSMNYMHATRMQYESVMYPTGVQVPGNLSIFRGKLIFK